jgi:hypothetical protein
MTYGGFVNKWGTKTLMQMSLCSDYQLQLLAVTGSSSVALLALLASAPQDLLFATD